MPLRFLFPLLCLPGICACAPLTERLAIRIGNGTVVRHAPELDALVPADYRIEKLEDGFVFLEGPVWVADPGFLLFSDLVGNAVYRWSPRDGARPYLNPAYTGPPPGYPGAYIGANGLALDAEGRLVLCEHGHRRISRMALGSEERETLVESYRGHRLNSPNDLVFHSSGSLYFTDPPYGLEGWDDSPEKELEFNGVYRLDPDGQITLLTAEMSRPNGIALSPDEGTLYVANAHPGEKVWMAFPVRSDRSIGPGRVFFDATSLKGSGVPDGMKVDSRGNLFATGPGGVLVLDPGGRHLGTIRLGRQPANLGWGGEDLRDLYITARTTLYRIRLQARGLPHRAGGEP